MAVEGGPFILFPGGPKVQRYATDCSQPHLKTLSFRELFEECNLTAKNLDHVGILKFEFVGQPQIMEVHVFKTRKYEGSIQESEGIRSSISLTWLC